MLKNKQPPAVPPQKARREHSVGRDRERGESGGSTSVDPNHWSLRVQETVVSALPEESLHVTLLGGADNGYFLYLDEIPHDRIAYHTGRLEAGGIVLEIQGQRIAGYTLRDAMIWLKQVGQNGAPVMIKTVRPGPLPKDLRQYLAGRFPKGSIDHDLQQTIRDNLYLRTVPCTTREPRPGEVNGVDYTFLSQDEFSELEKGGSLLESGVFDGNLYGTPKPPKDPQGQIPRRTSSISSILPGTQASSDKRRRSRTDSTPKSPGTPQKSFPEPPPRDKSLEKSGSSSSLGPLPQNWEMAFTADGHPYFIDHNTEQTHWLDPRRAEKQAQESAAHDGEAYYPYRYYHIELPYGWEKVEDPHYGTYYIDHVNRKTQYEHPASALRKSSTADDINNTSTLPRRGKNGDFAKRSVSESDMNGRNTPPAYHPRTRKLKTPLSKRVAKRVFCKNPQDLQGELFRTSLLKSDRGLGFTIIGGDNRDEEFLQIKNVVRNGPAFKDGKLQTGDVLVYVNHQLVLGLTHQDVVILFQTIQPGEHVELEICRGYPLPFDPDDPNTEIITTIAVGHNDTHGSNSPVSHSSRDMERHDLSSRSLKSLPELVKSTSMGQVPEYTYPKGHDSNAPDVLGQTNAEVLTIGIVRGDKGFGFTIADSQYGQKVKHILDQGRCKNLQEGDFIQQINGIYVSDMTHAQIVNVLKICPEGEETLIVVQRGGIPKSKRPIRPTDGADSFNSGLPGAYFFNDKGEPAGGSGALDGDGYMNMSRAVRDEIDSVPPEIPRRPRTPGSDRPRTPSENRPKTPTKLALQDDSRPPRGNLNAPNSAHLPRKQFSPPDSRNYVEHSDLNSSRPPPGPRFDPFRSETGSRSDYRGRTNYQGHSGFDRDPYGRNESAKPGQFRSRTPGPEMMQRSPGPDYRPEMGRPKTPTAADMRSKTPVPGLYGQVPGGNSDYSRNAQYPNSWGNNNSSVPYNRGYDSNTRTWGSSIPEHPITPNMQRRDNMDGRMNSSASMGAGRPPRQGTSFESEDPVPSNVMRIPKRMPYPHPSLSNHHVGSQSPKPFRYPGNIEDNAKFMEMNVTLKRQESGFGFRIIGGTEEGSQVAVGHIVPGGAADIDSRLRTGDEILFCDGICVVNSSHHKVVQLMGNAGLVGQVSLGVRRRIAPTSDGYPYDVIVKRRENEGFGFVIISSVTKAAGSALGESIDKTGGCSKLTMEDILNKKNLYPWIGRILENSPAERCGQLHVGDRILAVNGVDISHLNHEDIVNIIKESGFSVVLTVGPPQDDSSSGASQRSSQGSMVNAMAFPTLNDNRRGDFPPPPGHRFPPPPPPKEINRGRVPNHQEIQEDTIYVVDLNRGHRGFGFSIRGGQEFNNMPLFVLRIAEGGAADLDGRLLVGDQLLEINGFSTENMNHSEAIDIIQNGGPTLHLVVRRTGKPPPSFVEPVPSPGMRYPPSGPVANGPIGQSSPYLGRRNMNSGLDRDEHMYLNQPPKKTYLNN